MVGSPRRRRGRTCAHVQSRRVLVRAEAKEARTVADAPLLDLVVADLDHELRPERRLRELSGAPAVRLGEAAVGRALQQRLHELERHVVSCGRDGAGTDVVELVLVVEPEEQRGEPRRLLLPADADDDAVRRLLGLHLHDAVARAGEIRQVAPLGDDPVETDRLEPLEPFDRLVQIARGGRELETLRDSPELRPPLRERLLPDLFALPDQHVEGNESRGDLRGQLSHAGSRPGGAASAWRRSRARPCAR